MGWWTASPGSRWRPCRRRSNAAPAWPAVPALGQARRPHRSGRGRQQGPQAGVPLRRRPRPEPPRWSRSARPVEPLPDDRRRRRPARARCPPRPVRRRPARPEGNQRSPPCSAPSCTSSAVPTTTGASWRSPGRQLTAELAADGVAPHSIPIGGSTAVGALGYAAAFGELIDQFAAAGIAPRGIVLTSASGGTHAGLVAGRALAASGRARPPAGARHRRRQGCRRRASRCRRACRAKRSRCSASPAWPSSDDDVVVDDRWLGDDYAVPTRRRRRGDRLGGPPRRLGARPHLHGQGFSGLLGNAAAGRWSAGDDVVFIHTGGLPAVFAASGERYRKDLIRRRGSRLGGEARGGADATASLALPS